MNIKKLKMYLKKILHINEYYAESLYLSYVEILPLNEKSILLECQHGTNLNGNIFYILKELLSNSDYKDFSIFLSVNKNYKKNIQTLLENYHLNNVVLVEMKTKKYYKTIASVKYLINDNTFLPFFIKKEGQIYLNTWHGTPLKTLGKKINNDFHNIGNTMRNFISSDFLLYPNEYTRDHMIEDYMLENISKSKIVLNGYPRNTAFFDETRKIELIEKFKLKNKKIIAYMPTWRGTVADKDSNNDEIKKYFLYLDQKLASDYILYVNFHPIVHAMFDFTEYKHIKPFPNDIETYEFLNLCDCLITDYSSVFFDYALTRKKIILFTYDQESYFQDRGVYMSLEKLPFPKVQTVEELLTEILLPKNYDDNAFINEFCQYENRDATKQLLELLLFNNIHVKIESIPSNGKENVLIYSGNLAKNGITSSLMSLLANIDLTKRNYYLTFHAKKVSPYKNVLKSLPNNVYYFPVMGKMNCNIKEKQLLKRYRQDKVSLKEVYNTFKKIFSYEIKRRYANVDFSKVIHFTGYEYKTQLLFSFFEHAKRIIYVHSDMVEEIKTRNNQHRQTLEYVYRVYDKVALVTPSMHNPTKEISKKDDNFVVASNFFDYKRILEMSKQPICFDENTVCNYELEEVEQILSNNDLIKFISIGRFSPEKGHERLIRSFDRFYTHNNPHSYLLIIGGHGVEYDKVVKLIASLKSKNNIILIKSMTNPYSVLKKCDCFVLSSFYEGLGLVLLEADVLGLPVFSTDINGPRYFLEKNGGYLVSNDEEGIYQGMLMFFNGKLKVMNVDYEQYNQLAMNEFESMLEY